MTQLSVITPIRIENQDSEYLLERCDDLTKELSVEKNIECIVVDSGSRADYSKKIEEIVINNHCNYYFLDTRDQSFSVSCARNFGLRKANSQITLFFDVDFRVRENFWPDLFKFINLMKLYDFKTKCFTLPLFYLSENETKKYLENKENYSFEDTYIKWLYGSSGYIDNFAISGASLIVANRIHLMSLGGMDEDFRGHGYEDFELLNRLIVTEGSIPFSREYYLDQKTWNTYTYRGFRSFFAITARAALLKNLYVVHLYHPRPASASFYNKKLMKICREIYQSKVNDFNNGKNFLEPLSKSEDRILFFGTINSNVSRMIKDIIPVLGSMIYTDENNYIDDEGNFLEEYFKKFLKNNKIDKIFFTNPFGNENRLRIYNWVKKQEIEYYTFDRGALPDSWFIDCKGFNGLSDSYNEKIWNLALENESKLLVHGFINKCINGDMYLEVQGPHINERTLRNKLNLRSDNILFVPLQRPNDTVIKYMRGELSSYQEFITLIDQLANILKRYGWSVVVKKHPLESEHFNFQYAKYAPDDSNFVDLLNYSSAVALINSGVGVYSMMMNKPTYIFGNAFYSINNVNVQVARDDYSSVASLNSLANKIVNGYKVNEDLVEKFIYYLRYKFYSFGVSSNYLKKNSNGSYLNLTNEIDFYELRINGKEYFKFKRFEKEKIPLLAPIFERYQLDLFEQRMLEKKNQTSTIKNAVQEKIKKSDEVKLVNNHTKLNKTNSKGKIKRKIYKLFKNPRRFFLDSNFSFIHKIGEFI